MTGQYDNSFFTECTIRKLDIVYQFLFAVYIRYFCLLSVQLHRKGVAMPLWNSNREFPFA